LIYPTVTDCTVTDHHWWTYHNWFHGDWPSLLTLLWLVGSSMMVSHRAISHSRIYQWWSVTVQSVIVGGQDCDCMVTDHHWWPYCDWLHGDWPSLMTLLWLHGDTIIDDPTVTDCMVTDHYWFTLRGLDGQSPCNPSHCRVINDGQTPCNPSHCRVINDGQSPCKMTLLWLIAWWMTIIDDPTVTDHHWWPYSDWDCMVTDHHWWPYSDWDCTVTDHHWWPFCDWDCNQWWSVTMQSQ
jgi:hypothetical protein